ncbi:hypothetical protein ACTJLB_29395 [Paraburkholderia sp. 22098]|uniref:hypothetical protein n=1 Tax=Paraburkholderia sp. 22098 TaxID=3453874 RepID=UPI003F8358E2
MLKLTFIHGAGVDAGSTADVFIAACGYEGRARAWAEGFETAATTKLAFGFASQLEFEYQANKTWFRENNFEIIEVGDGDFRESLEHRLERLNFIDSSAHFEIDISCFNRFRLAHIIDILRTLPLRRVSATFRYSIAKFTAPVEDSAPTITVQPVIPQFAGWTTRPDRPPAAVVGLGYEPNKAIGIVDLLEINNATWAYYPLGPIDEYHDEVLRSNDSLLKMIRLDGRCLPYDLQEPVQLFHEMNSLVDMLRGHFNPVLIPFGPKLFALVSLLVATVHDDVGVWRVSSGNLEKPVNRESSGHFISMHVGFEEVVRTDEL